MQARGRTYMQHRGQSSTEMITILAVLLIITAIAIVMISSFSATSGGFYNQRSKAYWGSQAKPLLVTDWKVNVVAATPKEASVSMELHNPTSSAIAIKSITISPGYFNGVTYLSDGSEAGDADALDIMLASGGRIGLVLAQEAGDGQSVEVPTSYEFNLTIGYDRGMGVEKQVGSVPLSGRWN